MELATTINYCPSLSCQIFHSCQLNSYWHSLDVGPGCCYYYWPWPLFAASCYNLVMILYHTV